MGFSLRRIVFSWASSRITSKSTRQHSTI
jgi:hypothetical protein